LNEIDRMGRLLASSHHGPAWHGPTLIELIEDVTPAEAAHRPIAGAHTIEELVAHVAAWKAAVVRRLDGEAARLNDDEDFPVRSAAPDAARWNGAVRQLADAHALLTDRIAGLEPHALDRTLPGPDASARDTIHGVILHDIYHAGQVALLRKAARQSRPV
jgi:uncharacterized damage-inducible protein DinB